MRRLLLASLVGVFSLSLIFLFVSSKSVSNQEGYVPQEEYVPNEVLVKFKKDVSKYSIQYTIDSVLGKIITFRQKEISAFQWDPDLSSLRSFRLDPYLLHIKVPETIGTELAIYILSQNPDVKYAEKNFIGHPFAIYPNDDYFYRQWGLFNMGPSGSGGTWHADINAPDAWNIFTGSSDIVVAVIDNGVDYEHEDLIDNIWINWAEYNGNEDEDDDENGYVDDVYGWDWYASPNGGEDADPMPYTGSHGTHIAGIIGAKGNNDRGVAGVNWNVKIMALKIAHNGAGYRFSEGRRALEYALENGACISNNSWGWTNYSQALYDSIETAKDEYGHLYIAAAGNWPGIEERNNDIQPVYPASYDLDNIISVASTDHNDELSDLSHYGLNSVDLGAPGATTYYPDPVDETDIYSTLLNDNYGYKRGTSMAAPYVAGVAALVWGCRPDLSWSQVKNAIMNSVDPKSSLSGKTVTGGRLNAYKAITVFPPPGPAAPSNLMTYPDCFEMRLTWQDNSNNEQGFKIEMKSGPRWYYFDQVGPNVTTWTCPELWCGELWCFRVYAFNQDGNSPYSPSKCDKTTPCYYCDPWGMKITPDKEIISSGESVTYTYEVENKGYVDLTDIELIDEKFGTIAKKFTLEKGETKTFTKTVALTVTTTNCAKATAVCRYEKRIKNVEKHACTTVDVRR